MKPISGDVYGLLMAQGLRAMTVSAVKASGIDAGLPVREQTDPLTMGERAHTAAHPTTGPHTGGGKAGPMGISGKGRGTMAPPVCQEVGKRHRSDSGHMGNTVFRGFVVHTNHNVSTMPTRQDAIRRTSSLVCIEGGKR